METSNLPSPLGIESASESASRARNHAKWLYWIAGASAINALFLQFEIPIQFSFGLGITELVYALGQRLGSVFVFFGAAFDVFTLGCLIVLGILAGRLNAWAFLVGLLVLAADTILLGWLAGAEKIVSIVVHLAGIVALWCGFRAARIHSSLSRLRHEGTLDKPI